MKHVSVYYFYYYCYYMVLFNSRGNEKHDLIPLKNHFQGLIFPTWDVIIFELVT